MADGILGACQVIGYTLPEAARQRILAEAPGHKLRAKIERQRNAFTMAKGTDGTASSECPSMAPLGAPVR